MKNITYTDKKGQTWNYQIPFEITCTISGQVKTYTSEEYINGKIDRFGGLDQLRASYVCRDAKKAVKGASKEGKTSVVIGDKEVKVESTNFAKIDFGKPTPTHELQPITYDNSTPDVCYNPKWFLDGKPCDKCAWAKMCKCKDTEHTKKMAAKISKK